jgi:hypothetical protein
MKLSQFLAPDQVTLEAAHGEHYRTHTHAENALDASYRTARDKLEQKIAPRTDARELAEVLQQWEGVVTEIHEDTFCATLIDLTNNAQPRELVKLYLSEISDADRHIFSEGSVFYWTIGRHWSPGGQMTRVSKIRLRRTPRWTRNAVAMIESRANSLMERYSNDSSSNSPAHR